MITLTVITKFLLFPIGFYKRVIIEKELLITYVQLKVSIFEIGHLYLEDNSQVC